MVIKEFTKGFKESNFNLTKSMMEMFLELCNLHSSLMTFLDTWICKAAVTLEVEKILIIFSTKICSVKSPRTILHLSIKVVDAGKSPLPHQDLLIWV